MDAIDRETNIGEGNDRSQSLSWAETISSLNDEPRLWDRFTLAEEYDPAFLDQFGRFPVYLSRSGPLFVPEISHHLSDHGFSPPWPEDHTFALCLTHDIDSITVPRLGNLWQGVLAAKRGELAGAARRWLSMAIRRMDSLRNLDAIMEIEEAFDARSTFFLLALSPGDADYTYSVEELAGDCARAIDRGFEIGLHGGHEAYRDLDAMSREKARLERVIGRPVTGYRNHYLRFKVPETWAILSEAGFTYDATLGFADCAGFRNGCCHPFRPFDRRRRSEINLLELPLVVMDRTLERMSLDQPTSRTLVRNLVDEVAACRGVMTVLWHNQQLATESGQSAYRDLLMYAQDRGAWMTGGNEVARWWNSNVLG